MIFPLKLKVVSRPGYKFIHWTFDGVHFTVWIMNLRLYLTGNKTLNPVFEKIQT